MLKPQHAEKNLINFRRCRECRLASLALSFGGGAHPRRHDMQAKEAADYSTDDDAWNEMSELLRPISVICSPTDPAPTEGGAKNRDELTYDASKDVSWDDYFPPPPKTPPPPPLILYLTHDSL